MQQVSPDIWAAFERRLDQAQVPAGQRPGYLKWVRFYFDFCSKYGHSPALPTSLGPFLNKLAAKNQSVGRRIQASAAVRLLIQACKCHPLGRVSTGKKASVPNFLSSSG